MKTTLSTLIEAYFVTPAWVARYYGVPRQEVYRAIKSGRLTAVRVRGRISGGRDGYVLDSRELPEQFPKAGMVIPNGG